MVTATEEDEQLGLSLDIFTGVLGTSPVDHQVRKKQ